MVNQKNKILTLKEYVSAFHNSFLVINNSYPEIKSIPALHQEFCSFMFRLKPQESMTYKEYAAKLEDYTEGASLSKIFKNWIEKEVKLPLEKLVDPNIYGIDFAHVSDNFYNYKLIFKSSELFFKSHKDAEKYFQELVALERYVSTKIEDENREFVLEMAQDCLGEHILTSYE